MKNVLGVLFLPILLLGVGCGGGEGRPFTDHSKDPEAYARNVKHAVMNSVAEARRSDEPCDSVQSIVDMLEDLERAPSGAYRDTYEQLRTLALETHQACEASSRPPADLRSRLDELTALAEKLPGEVTIAERSRD